MVSSTFFDCVSISRLLLSYIFEYFLLSFYSKELAAFLQSVQTTKKIGCVNTYKNLRTVLSFSYTTCTFSFERSLRAAVELWISAAALKGPPVWQERDTA